jgi:hypothetical protein
VVEADGRERGCARGDHVRRIEPPAEARLDHRYVDARVREGHERAGDRRLELGHVPVGPGLDPRDGCGDIGRRGREGLRPDLGAVDAGPLAPAPRVRGEAGTGPQAARPEQRLAHRGDRRLAVRPDDVQRLV